MLQLQITVRRAIDSAELVYQEASMLIQMEKLKIENGGKPVDLVNTEPRVNKGIFMGSL